MKRIVTERLTNRYGSKGVISSISEPFIEKYRCECKNITGKLFEGIVCSKCRTEVKFREYDMTKLIDIADMYLEHQMFWCQELNERPNDITISGELFVLTSTFLKKRFVMVNKNEKEYVIRAINNSMNRTEPVLEDNKPIYLYFGLNSFNPLVAALNEVNLDEDGAIVITGALDESELSELIEKFSDRYIIEMRG